VPVVPALPAAPVLVLLVMQLQTPVFVQLQVAALWLMMNYDESNYPTLLPPQAVYIYFLYLLLYAFSDYFFW